MARIARRGSRDQLPADQARAEELLAFRDELDRLQAPSDTKKTVLRIAAIGFAWIIVLAAVIDGRRRGGLTLGLITAPPTAYMVGIARSYRREREPLERRIRELEEGQDGEAPRLPGA